MMYKIFLYSKRMKFFWQTLKFQGKIRQEIKKRHFFCMECISCQCSDRFLFSVLYNIAESLSRFWFYALHNFGCFVSLVSLLSRDFSSQCPY